jgi:translocation protein SEC66
MHQMLTFSKKANAFSPNWGQTIFQSANEIAANQAIRKRMDELQGTQKAEREWWDQRKASIQSDFMKELDEEPASTTAKSALAGSRTSDDDAVLVEAGGPVDKQSGGGKKKKGKN